MENNNNVLEIRGLNSYFFTEKGVAPAVDGLDLDIPKGKIIGLVGESGCGKSMTAKSIMGLLKYPGRVAGGSIRFEDQDLTRLSDYPLAFSRISDMPLVLYCTGDPRWLNEPAAVGMVGTRKPTEYGLRAAEDIGRGLARAGAVIVSGLADGLDSAGHRAAVGENCPTIAVMGVPIDRTYPAANRELRRAIERRGCVISEYPPESEPVGAVGFLQRNRLIAALSGALVVVEAKEKSGTMSTVGHAERYGKPVFAVPGSIFSPASAGTNALLRDGRAKAVCTAADLFGTLGLQTARPAPAPRETPRPLSENERLVLSCLGAKAQGVEELGVKSGLPTAALLGVLMKLELAGRVSCLPGKRYILRGGSAS